MKTHRSISSSLLGFALLALSAGTFIQAQPIGAANSPVWERQTQSSARRGRVQRVNAEAESFGISQMAGRPVRSANGEQLSTITDFLVEPQTGRVRFAMLPSGGGPNGMTYRIVPISAFASANQDALVLRFDRGQWDRVGTMEESQLGGHVVIDVDHQQRLSRQLGLPQAEIYDGQGAAELVRASTLRGQTIRSGDGRVGRIEDVVVDVTRHESAVVFTSDQSFAGSEQRYVVPFQHLGTNESGTWMSRLNREDFANDGGAPTDSRYQSASNDPRYQGSPNDPRYQNAPTDSRYQNAPNDSRYSNQSPRDRRDYEAPPVQTQANDIESAAAAVQQTIDRSRARGRVDVAVDGRRIILRGMVDTEQERAELERAASDTARGLRIENQIAVRRR